MQSYEIPMEQSGKKFVRFGRVSKIQLKKRHSTLLTKIELLMMHIQRIVWLRVDFKEYTRKLKIFMMLKLMMKWKRKK